MSLVTSATCPTGVHGADGRPRRARDASPSVLDDDVVAGPAVEHVDAGATDQNVVAGTAQQRVRTAAADEHVGAVAAIGREPDRVGRTWSARAAGRSTELIVRGQSEWATGSRVIRVPDDQPG